MKRLAILLLIATMLLASCGTPAAGGEDTTNPADTTLAPETTAAPEEPKAPAFVVEESILGINRTPQYNGTFASDKVKVTDIEKKYISNTTGGYTYFTSDAPQVEVSGLPFNDVNSKKFFRLEYASNSKYSKALQDLAYQNAGVRIRFKTDATSIEVAVALQKSKDYDYMPITGTQELDVYVGNGANAVWDDNSYSMTGKKYSLPTGVKDVTIVLPLCAGARRVTIALPSGCYISSPDPYVVEDPVVFYGSSATQGIGASRPGMAYPEVVTRILGANHVNFGFADAALGEPIVAQTIAKIKMSAFVYDYSGDSTVDNLRATHYDFYKTVRDAQPNVPIIILSRYNIGYNCTAAEAAERNAIIKETYDKAVAAGDTNVYFIDGTDIFPENYGDFCLVDKDHLNDLGMYFVADAIYPVLKDALTKAGSLK